MTDTDRFAALLHDEWCIHFDPAEFSIPPEPTCEQRAARLIAAGVTLAPTPPDALPHTHRWEPNTTLDGWRCEEEMCGAQPPVLLRPALEKAMDVGIYPAATPDGPRTERQTGWNEGVMAVCDAIDAVLDALAPTPPDALREAAERVVGRFLDTPASLAGVHVAALNDLRAALTPEDDHD